MKRLGIDVVGVEVIVDGGDEVGSGPEDAAADCLVGEITEPAFYEIEPRARGRRENCRWKPRVLLQPRVDVGVAVGTVIIKDQVDLQSFWDLPVDCGAGSAGTRRGGAEGGTRR